MNLNKILFMFVFAIILFSCKTSSSPSVETQSIVLSSGENSKTMTLSVTTGEGHNHPTFAIWLEDLEGNYINTVFVTKSFATGIFGHAALTDSTWGNEPGESYRPAALPYWSHKKGYIDGNYIIPEKDHPYVDGYSGATPKGDFTLNSDLPKSNSFRVLLEVNQTWDWNKYWTNNKFPKDINYLSSAQPSVVYAVTVNLNDPIETYVLNPIGHGHHSGENGLLYTDLTGFTSALKIFERIEITFN